MCDWLRLTMIMVLILISNTHHSQCLYGFIIKLQTHSIISNYTEIKKRR